MKIYILWLHKKYFSEEQKFPKLMKWKYPIIIKPNGKKTNTFNKGPEEAIKYILSFKFLRERKFPCYLNCCRTFKNKNISNSFYWDHIALILKRKLQIKHSTK